MTVAELPPAAAPVDLEQLAAQLPCRVIHGEQGPYLSRYTLAALPSGGHVYLHHFHRSDADRDLHNHPWPGSSIILAGGYNEERRETASDGSYFIEPRVRFPGDIVTLEPDTFHRVDLLDPVAGCWTLFTTGMRSQSWGFWNRDTGILTPWRDALASRGLL